jgi:hypothetical protein
MQKFVFLISLLWLFVFLFREKKNKFFFLISVDAILLIFLFLLHADNLPVLLLLLVMTDFFVLLMPDEDAGFEKKDVIFVISLIFVLPVIFFVKKSENVFTVQPSIMEGLLLILSFFLFAVVCFFVLKDPHLNTDEKK